MGGKMIELVRVDGTTVPETMFVRPNRPDDHREFEFLLPRCEPLYIYADKDGRDWVRWALPKTVAEQLGWEMRCACCKLETPIVESPGGDHVHIDTAYDEVDWYLNTAPRQF